MESVNILFMAQDTKIKEIFDTLTNEEKHLIYYLYRAGLYGNSILTHQLHRYAQDHETLFKILYDFTCNSPNNIEKLKASFDLYVFSQQVRSFYIFLWANHSQYFVREHANEKRTPACFGLNLLTRENLLCILKQILFLKETVPTSTYGYNIENAIVNLSSDIYCQSLFVKDYEPTLTVEKDIEKSCVNAYSRNFTNADYEKLTPQQKNKINNTFHKSTLDDTITIQAYCANENGVCNKTIAKMIEWLEIALNYVDATINAKKTCFDKHLQDSLWYLIRFLDSGDEEMFRQHSIAWLKTNNRIDYNFGFVEVYTDPKSIRGYFQCDITVRTIDMEKVNAIIPKFEQQLPYSSEDFKRDFSNQLITNASINHRMYASGHLGPISYTAAYCLPNYDDIRSTVGSKQIIYELSGSIGMQRNRMLQIKLNYSDAMIAWSLDQGNDVDFKLDDDIWNLQCILHETIGHGSGKFSTHTFEEGDVLKINDVTYNVGESIPVNSNNYPELLRGYGDAIEEMRAEIIALYVSVFHLDDLLEQGIIVNKWVLSICSKEYMTERLILSMCSAGISRIRQQSLDATEMNGAHALANNTIMTYLINKGGIEVLEKQVKHDDITTCIVPYVSIVDVEKAKNGIKDLFVMVQTIRSTGNGLLAEKLISQFGKPIYKPAYVKILDDNRKLVVGNIKAQVTLFPSYELKLHDYGITSIELKYGNTVDETIALHEKMMK